MKATGPIKKLHARTGSHVLAAKRRTRTLLPEYVALLTKRRSRDVLADLTAVRGKR